MEIFKTLIALVTNLFKKTDPKKFTPKPTETPPETRSKLPVVETKDPDVIEPESTAEIIEDNSVKITASHLYSLGIKSGNVKKYIEPLNNAIKKYNIDTPLKISHFLAQVLHESGYLKFSEELSSGEQYEGRKDLGNINLGDGKLYKGRGAIQITGRCNYEAYSNYNGIDFIKDPKKILEPIYVIDSAAWFWSVFKKDKNGNSLNDMASNNNFLRITYFINGGFNGIVDRFNILKRMYSLFNIPRDGLLDILQNIESIINKSENERTTMEKSLIKTIPNIYELEKLKK